SNAANARAFNLWLMDDWLEENDYTLNNVAVFDFYNVLTGEDGHHTFENGQEVHQAARKDTLAFPSGDDHPSIEGSQKATNEFIPLLNYFYNRWQVDAPALHPQSAGDSAEENTDQAEYSQREAPPELSGVIDNFEGEAPAGTNGWEAYWDEGTPSSLVCGVESGSGISSSGLQLDYHITPHSWGTCGLSFDNPQDWSASPGLVFSILAGQTGGVLHIDLYVEGPEGQESYIYELDLEPRMEEEWVLIGILWNLFQRVDWEEDAGSPFKKEDQISGLAFGFGTEDNEEEGLLWIDDLGWMVPREVIGEEVTSSQDNENKLPAQEESRGFNLPCIGSLALPLGLAGAAVLQRKKVK
ncbi:MAG: hypothetical protein HQ574_07860, partial [Chloroflexi bacterium]|nr:hypothetical protein [Chloroflexota bacterium]